MSIFSDQCAYVISVCVTTADGDCYESEAAVSLQDIANGGIEAAFNSAIHDATDGARVAVGL